MPSSIPLSSLTPRRLAAESTPESPLSLPTAGSPSVSPIMPDSASGEANAKAERCHVAVRVRPLMQDEILCNQIHAWDVDTPRHQISTSEEYNNRNRLNKEKPCFYYDNVATGSDNHALYESAIRKLVWSAMEGYNGTVFAYGQTASGKTFTMMGNEDEPGVIPQAIDDVFSYIREQPTDREFLLRVSYMEIYNETIRDLLTPDQTDLRIYEDRKAGVYVSPLKEEIVTTPKQVLKVLARGETLRHVGTTDWNDRSSRSHTIFQMIIESRDRSASSSAASPKPLGSPGSRVSPPTSSRSSISGGSQQGPVTISQLNLIDLAGSERATSNVERRAEGAFINKSLLTLGSVIAKITEEKSAHIPFRDSKLTRILQSALTGHARIAVICTISPTLSCFEESHNTLKFASRVKKVKSTASQNQLMDDKALIQKYKGEILELKSTGYTRPICCWNRRDSRGTPRAMGVSAETRGSDMKSKTIEHLHESQLICVRTALKERIDHLQKLILSSNTITSKPIPDYSHTDKKHSVIVSEGLLPPTSTKTHSFPPAPTSGITSPAASSSHTHFPARASRAGSQDAPPAPPISRIHDAIQQLKQESNPLLASLMAELENSPREALRRLADLQKELLELGLSYQELVASRDSNNSGDREELIMQLEEARELIKDLEYENNSQREQLGHLQHKVRDLELAQFEKLESEARP
ncbi:hypothetical protein SeMB42_g05089 [Synchytrium endobioticum]|uniref:Kinesin-like protein n=1 Tax=Synchytrium endobioticum TaxID=286115 RepID=A0A507CTR1_9FUNG|nr:hypothetical protein SeMB42_g05089 [Synchytrium endobioticum]